MATQTQQRRSDLFSFQKAVLVPRSSVFKFWVGGGVQIAEGHFLCHPYVPRNLAIAHPIWLLFISLFNKLITQLTTIILILCIFTALCGSLNICLPMMLFDHRNSSGKVSRPGITMSVEKRHREHGTCPEIYKK